VIRKDERGVAVMAAAMLLVCLGIAALVVDFGLILANRMQISTAADAAALAGAQELPNKDAAQAVAQNYVLINAGRVPNIASAVTFPAGNVIRVHTTSGSPLFFSRVLGLTDFSIGSIAESTRFDPNVAIIIDRSGSMCVDSYPSSATNGICPENGPWEPFSTVQQIANNFVDQFRGNPTFTLISFSSYATLDAALTQDRVAIKAAINNLRPGGTTDIAASLRTSINQLLLATGRNPNLIVLMTDGLSNTIDGVYYGDGYPGAQQAIVDAASTAHDKGMIIYGINYGLGADNTLMQQITQTTDGKFYYAPTDEMLKTVYAEIGAKAYIRLTYVN